MIFRWLRGRRRAKLLATPFPEAWRRSLEALPFYGTLDADERSRLEAILRVIVAEKRWEGLGGLELGLLTPLSPTDRCSSAARISARWVNRALTARDIRL